VNCSHSVGVILLCVYKSCLGLLYELLFSPVQSVLVGIIRVSVSGWLRCRGSITDVQLGGASDGTEVKVA